ncbi:PREDICTED: uncharacterized protein LOC108365069 [Rhagoletis zephyria]|uniref:uncharacterized protein LOC108365069 n=1 Tax=Rhagoletis zephyria TaxID=28612 RepID=UPI0008112123|nr:PREDICTED: uncharacterized protein LOC108365069 [Rhagoletis zephyria]
MSVMFASITTVGTTVGTTITSYLRNSTSTVYSAGNKSIAITTALTTSSSDNVTETPWLSTTVEPAASGTVIITDDYWYWGSLYYFYIILLLFLCFGLILAGITRNKRSAEAQRGNDNICTYIFISYLYYKSVKELKI